MVFLCFFLYPHHLTHQPTLVGQTAAVTAFDHKVFPWGVLGARREDGGRGSFLVREIGILDVQIFPFSFLFWDVFRFFILLYTPYIRRLGVFFLIPLSFLSYLYRTRAVVRFDLFVLYRLKHFRAVRE